MVKRHQDRARKRLDWEHAKAKSGRCKQIHDKKGAIVQDPTDDGLNPPVSKEISAEHSPFPDLGPNWNAGKGGTRDRTCHNPNTPRREGATLETRDSQRQKLDEDAGTEREAREFRTDIAFVRRRLTLRRTSQRKIWPRLERALHTVGRSNPADSI